MIKCDWWTNSVTEEKVWKKPKPWGWMCVGLIWRDSQGEGEKLGFAISNQTTQSRLLPQVVASTSCSTRRGRSFTEFRSHISMFSMHQVSNRWHRPTDFHRNQVPTCLWGSRSSCSFQYKQCIQKIPSRSLSGLLSEISIKRKAGHKKHNGIQDMQSIDGHRKFMHAFMCSGASDVFSER